AEFGPAGSKGRGARSGYVAWVRLHGSRDPSTDPSRKVAVGVTNPGVGPPLRSTDRSAVARSGSLINDAAGHGLRPGTGRTYQSGLSSASSFRRASRRRVSSAVVTGPEK